MKAEVFKPLQEINEKMFKITYPSSCGELPREAHTNSWAAALPLSSAQQHLGKEINANSLGLPCLPSQLCKLCRNPKKGFDLVPKPFPPAPCRQTSQPNPSPACLC